MAKNSFGYIVVRWKVEEPETEGGYPLTTFTVPDEGKDGKELEVGTLKMYGKGTPKDLIKNIGNAVIEAQYHQRHEIPAVD